MSKKPNPNYVEAPYEGKMVDLTTGKVTDLKPRSLSDFKPDSYASESEMADKKKFSKRYK